MTAISKDTAAFLGIARPGPIAENARMEKNNDPSYIVVGKNKSRCFK